MSYNERETTEQFAEKAEPRQDNRRETVKPDQRPAPSSPEPDQDAVRKGEEILERVKAY